MNKIQISNNYPIGLEVLSRNEMINVMGGTYYHCICAGTPATAANFIVDSVASTPEGARDDCNAANGGGDKCEAEAY
ncbi:hypothetical protein [Sphingobacterium chungjuense]|uniref:hypothetical protein n=1 Tax=Sphingobacterium chungjuense TaxID=2675553 RepID=UPI00140D1CD3|nr:hypothetical protein [Sphingobacterium chungjuense]